MSFQLQTALDFALMECGRCGVVFALTKKFMEHKKRKREGFTCPNGCSRIFTDKSDEEKLREQLKREQIEREHAQGLFEAERNSHRTTRGHHTRLKNRIAAGVCPCCNRQFQDLKRHMDGKHPDFKNK